MNVINFGSFGVGLLINIATSAISTQTGSYWLI